MLFSLIQLHSQEQFRYFPTGMKWEEVTAEPYSSSLDSHSSVLYEIGKDTIVNDRSCKIVIMNGNPLEQWIFEENKRVWIITKDYPEPIRIYDFNWNDDFSYYEFLRVNEISHETELVKTYLNRDEINVTTYKNQTIEYTLNYEGAVIRDIGRVSDLNRNSSLLGYKINEPVLPGLLYNKVVWIVRNGMEIFRSESADEWILYISDIIHDISSSIDNPSSPCPMYYDLSGRRLNDKPAWGIYIQNGRKFVVR